MGGGLRDASLRIGGTPRWRVLKMHIWGDRN